jgi:hypothetical protein
VPHSPSTKPLWSRARTIQQRSYCATRFTRPHKPDMRSYKSKLVHQGQNNAVLNEHRWRLPPWNLRKATALSPSFPSEWSTFSYLPYPVTTTYMNINITSTHHNHHTLLVQEKEVLHASGTCHSSSIDVYQLSISHLVDNINTSTTRMTYKMALPCNLSPPHKILHIVHNQHI